MSTPGAEVSTVLRLYGHVGSNEATLAFHDVHLPAGSLLGPEGDGLDLALSGTSVGRVYHAARATGVAAGALRTPTEYASDRRPLGTPLQTRQASGRER